MTGLCFKFFFFLISADKNVIEALDSELCGETEVQCKSVRYVTSCTKPVPFLVFVTETRSIKLIDFECKVIIKGSLKIIIQTYIAY